VGGSKSKDLEGEKFHFLQPIWGLGLHLQIGKEHFSGNSWVTDPFRGTLKEEPVGKRPQ